MAAYTRLACSGTRAVTRRSATFMRESRSAGTARMTASYTRKARPRSPETTWRRACVFSSARRIRRGYANLHENWDILGPLPMKKACTACGKQIPDVALDCVFCGARQPAGEGAVE